MATATRAPAWHRFAGGRLIAIEVAGAVGYASLSALLMDATASAEWVVASFLAAALVVRRRQPVLAAVLLAPTFAMSFADPTAGFVSLGPAALIAFGAATAASTPAAIAVLAVCLSGVVATGLPRFEHAGGIAPFAGFVVVAWLLGRGFGQSRRYREELARQHAVSAATDERLRIAREVHDVVGHSMSVIAVQAAFARLVLHRSPQEAEAALDAIGLTSRTALDDLRHTVRALRAEDEPAGLVPTPSLADVEPLLEQLRSCGFVVSVARDGATDGLPTGVSLAAYRVLQEALTNVIRHSRATRVEVEIAVDGSELRLRVSDDGDPPRPVVPGDGLRGMRERVHAHGGELRAEPRPERGFEVAATIPVARATA
jgi:signal transduction histidine kinase